MYARVSVTTGTKKEALVVPANAVVDLGGRRGVFTPLNESAVFRALELGTEQRDLVEVRGGLNEGDTVITTGSSALRDGDRIVLPGRGEGRGRRGGNAASGDGRPGGEPSDPPGRASDAARGSRGVAPSGARSNSTVGTPSDSRGSGRSGGEGAAPGASDGHSGTSSDHDINASPRGARDGRSRLGAPPAASPAS
jgi:hypothetical protein